MPFESLSLKHQRRIAYAIVALGLIIGIIRGDGIVGPPIGYGYVLDGIRERGVLVVLTRNAPTTYYYDAMGEQAGYEYELVEDFAAWLDVETRYVVLDTVADILEAVERGDGDIAAAGLTQTEAREERYLFGPEYKSIRQQLVCNRDGDWPRELEDLPGHSIEVIANSSYEERLHELASELGDLTWQTTSRLDTEGILGRVAEGLIDCTIADSNIVAINRRYEPALIVPFDVSEEQSLAWILPNGAVNLNNALGDWFEEVQESGRVSELEQKYYGHVEVFDFVDTRSFVRRIESRLPDYAGLFREVAEEHDFSWTMLAAQSYQESHWNPDARSPTGVRGLMMLTQAAAEDMGVTDRLDPEQSIRGGARYLASLYARVPERVQGDDRMFFALAAYNVGMGHLRDAMRLAEELGRDPTSWHDLREVLPLLARREYYSDLRYGYARGGEAVRYVQRIRGYWDILNQQYPAYDENGSFLENVINGLFGGGNN